VLFDIIKDIKEPVIFWLDGHYGGDLHGRGEIDCPILQELDAIFRSLPFDHFILIDDARCFNGENDYPTIEELTKFVLSKNPKYKMDILHDIICYTI